MCWLGSIYIYIYIYVCVCVCVCVCMCVCPRARVYVLTSSFTLYFFWHVLEGTAIQGIIQDVWIHIHLYIHLLYIHQIHVRFFMFEFPCIISLYYIKNQQDATLAVLFISNCKVTLHVSDAFCVHRQEY